MRVALCLNPIKPIKLQVQSKHVALHNWQFFLEDKFIDLQIEKIMVHFYLKHKYTVEAISEVFLYLSERSPNTKVHQSHLCAMNEIYQMC